MAAARDGGGPAGLALLLPTLKLRQVPADCDRAVTTMLRYYPQTLLNDVGRAVTCLMGRASTLLQPLAAALLADLRHGCNSVSRHGVVLCTRWPAGSFAAASGISILFVRDRERRRKAAAAARDAAARKAAEEAVAREADGVTFVVSLTRTSSGLGLVFDSRNAVKRMPEGCAAAEHGGIEVGDVLVAVDGLSVYPGQPLAPLFQNRSGGYPRRSGRVFKLSFRRRVGNGYPKPLAAPRKRDLSPHEVIGKAITGVFEDVGDAVGEAVRKLKLPQLLRPPSTPPSTNRREIDTPPSSGRSARSVTIS